jgi:hypothetical protein
MDVIREKAYLSIKVDFSLETGTNERAFDL